MKSKLVPTGGPVGQLRMNNGVAKTGATTGRGLSPVRVCFVTLLAVISFAKV